MVDCNWSTAPMQFAIVQQCERALAKWQYDDGHHGEECVELEGGGWCVYDSRGGRSLYHWLSKRGQVDEIARTDKCQAEHDPETGA